MVLSKEEFDTAEIGDIYLESKEKMSLLFQLRQSTRSFLIQCLADRELQTLIYSKPNHSSPKSAYNYNCTVVHNPHVWSHLNAISGHGWNIKRHQPFDPQLRVAHVLANQYSKNKQNNDDSLVLRNQQAREQIRQFEETIRILKEENTQVKQLYLKALQNERFQNVNHNNNASNNQQLNQHQEEIKTLKSVIESHKKTIQILTDRNYALQLQTPQVSSSYNQELNKHQEEIKTLKSVIVSHKETIQTLKDRNYALQLQTSQVSTSNNQLIRSLQQELRTMKCNLESKLENIRILQSQNNNLQVRLREAEINLSSNGLHPRTSRMEENVSKGCCTIM